MEVKLELLQEVVNYLSSRPWSEVNNLIVKLSEATKAESKKKPPKKE